MNAIDLMRFAVRAVSGYRLRSTLVLLAMAIGVAAVVILTALGEGARRYVANQFTSLGTHLLIVLPGRNETTGGPPPLLGETPRDLTLEDAQAMLRSPSVRRVAPLTLGTAQVARDRRDREALIMGTTAEMKEVRKLELAQGRFLPPGDWDAAQPVVVLGHALRQELFGTQPVIGEWVRIGDRRFRVIGVLGQRGQSLGSNMDEVAIIPVASAQMLFNTASLFRVLVEARSREDLASAKEDILRIVEERHEGERDITVITQDALLATFDRILHALTLTVAGIAAISLVVAGILVMNVMLVSVAQRTPEVGLLKAIGAPPHQILTLFLAEAALLSLAGGLLGLAVGMLGSALIGRVYPALPVGPPAWAVAAALGVALGTGLLFGVLPARRAARLDPVQALARR